MYWLRSWAAARDLGLTDSWEMTPWELSACFETREERELMHDARTAAQMLVTAQAHLKRQDGAPFTIGYFLPIVTNARHTAKQMLLETQDAEDPRERIIRQARNLERIANVTGMQGAELTADEWAELQRKEAERIAAIPKS